MNETMNKWIISVWMHASTGWMRTWINEQMKMWINEWTNEWTYEWIDEWMDEHLNDWKKKGIDKLILKKWTSEQKNVWLPNK